MISNGAIWPALHDAANHDIFHLVGAGAPTSSTGKGVAGKGCLYTDYLSGLLYINMGTILVPSWSGNTLLSVEDSLSFSTGFTDGLGSPLADVFPSVTLPGSGVRIFGNGLAATNSGVVVSIGPGGPVALLQTSNAIGSAIALGGGLSGSVPYTPDANGDITVSAKVSMVTDLLNRRFFIGVVKLAPDNIQAPFSITAGNINLLQADMAGILMDSTAFVPAGLYGVSNKANATPVVPAFDNFLNASFPPVGTYVRLTVQIKKDGTVILSADGVVLKTIPAALDPMTPIAPLLILHSLTATTKQMNAEYFVASGSR